MSIRKFINIVEDVFHGSPHKFDNFSTEFIGSGEGNYKFGWGLYFATKKEVGEFYKKSLTRRFTYKGRTVDPESFLHMAIYFLVYNDYNKENAKRSWKPGSKVYQLIDKIDCSKIRSQSYLYHVEIPDDSEFLLWDFSFEEQSPRVQTATRHLLRTPAEIEADMKYTGETDPMRAWQKYLYDRGREFNGEEIYETLSVQLRSDKKASLALLAAGVHGIKFLDNLSRKYKDGTYNYVIFDGSLTSIKKRVK